MATAIDVYEFVDEPGETVFSSFATQENDKIRVICAQENEKKIVVSQESVASQDSEQNPVASHESEKNSVVSQESVALMVDSQDGEQNPVASQESEKNLVVSQDNVASRESEQNFVASQISEVPSGAISYPFGYKQEKFEFLDCKFMSGRRINTQIVAVENGSEAGQTFELNGKLTCGSETWRCNYTRKCRSRIYKLSNNKFVKCASRFVAHIHEPSERQAKRIKSLQALQEVKEQLSEVQALVNDDGVRSVEKFFNGIMEKEE